VLKTLRYPRNRPYLRALIFVLLVSWISMLVSATCSMPSAWRIASAGLIPAGCSAPENRIPKHQGHATQPIQDCSLTPCPDSPPNPVFGFKTDKPEMPLFVLCLVWLTGRLLHDPISRRIPRSAAPPDGRRVPLIYRFCALLN
jgi:hypothetical protein